MITRCAGCEAEVLRDPQGGYVHVGSIATRFCDDPRPRAVPAAIVGQVVHYVARGSADGRFLPMCRMAFVTEVSLDTPLVVGLAVVNPSGFFFHPVEMGGIEFGAGDPAEGALGARCTDGDRAHPPGTWHIPEVRV